MFSAIGRFIKTIGYLLTGRIDDARRTLDMDPRVVRAKYEKIIAQKKESIQQYMRAVAGLITQQEKKKETVKSLTTDVQRLEQLRSGALAKAKQTVARLKSAGGSEEEVKKSEDYLKCLSAYNDFSSTLDEKQKRITELEQDIKTYGDRITEHKIQLQQLHRDLEKIKIETHDAVADMITAREEKQLADTISGISADGTAKELEDLRELRQSAKAESRISRELAGTDTTVQESEFIEYAKKSMNNTEFDALIGLAGQMDKGAGAAEKAKPQTETKLPE
jgi:chromosome segregation ATPase